MKTKPVHAFRAKDFIPFYGIKKYIDRCQTDALLNYKIQLRKDIETAHETKIYRVTQFPEPYQIKGFGKSLLLGAYNSAILIGTVLGVGNGLESLIK